MTTATSESKVDNGVNVEALLGAREALTAAPDAAKFKWRATVKWINGTHSRSTIDGFFGLGEEHKHKSTFTFEADTEALTAVKGIGEKTLKTYNLVHA